MTETELLLKYDINYDSFSPPLLLYEFISFCIILYDFVCFC
jgi:hypothetical protein